jgi:hypothetical protein
MALKRMASVQHGSEKEGCGIVYIPARGLQRSQALAPGEAKPHEALNCLLAWPRPCLSAHGTSGAGGAWAGDRLRGYRLDGGRRRSPGLCCPCCSFRGGELSRGVAAADGLPSTSRWCACAMSTTPVS